VNGEFLVVAAALTLIYGLFSALSERSILTPPMAFVLSGLLLGPGLGVVDLDFQSGTLEFLATVALVVIVCSDASQIDRRKIRVLESLPLRLLVVGLPLTMLLGTGLAMLIFPTAGIAAAALLAVLLSPTDAALGQAVITSEAVPEPVRKALNAESGLNDGIALPPIFALLFVLGANLGDIPTDNWLRFTALQLVLGPLAGTLLGVVGGRLIDLASRRQWMDPGFQRLTLPAIALLAYAVAEAIGGNGFIAAFISGFTLAVRTESVRERMQEFAETEGTLLSLLVFLTFGLVMVPESWQYWSPATTLYAILSLTVARILPVWLSVLGLGLDLRTVLFIGWFGPRGIASVLYILLWVRYLGLEGHEVLISTGVQTILLSVLLHGLTAGPFAKAYGNWEKAQGRAGS
jgi:NhaP-type Na+/H+ or K+/H+ antiporter